jgi:HAD superfamily hydrolase (TIGR01509 family)
MISLATQMNDTLIMLDLDGTLIDTSQLYLQGVPAVVKRHLGISICDQDIVPMWGQLARNFFTHFAKVVGRQDEALIDRMYAEFTVFYNEMHNKLSTAYDGVCEFLPTIREAVHAVGVVSTRPSSRSAPVLEMPWARNIDFFVWGDQVTRNKPFPDGIELAMQAHGVNGGACIYVGDNKHDIEAAQSCQRPVVSVAALWGAVDRQSLLDANPDLSFNAFREFADWVLEGGLA